MVKHFLHRIWHSSEAWTFLGTAVRVSANIVVLPMLVMLVPKQELGLWYVFGSLGALFSLLDLGFASNVTRATGFLWGGAPRLLPFGIAPTTPTQPGETHRPNYAVLGNLVATLALYYRWAGLMVFVLGTVGGGWWVIIKSAEVPGATSLRFAWLIYAVGLLVNFWSGFRLALLNGIGGVRRAQQAVVAAQVVYYVIVIPGLAFKGGLWALVCGNLAMGVTIRLLASRYFYELANGQLLGAGHVDWGLVRTLWPNAWRQGGAALGAFCVLQANTLICSAYLGLGETGMYGFSLQVVMVVAGISQVWVHAQVPAINQHRAMGDIVWVAKLFAQRVRRFVLTYWAAALFLIMLGPLVLNGIGAKTSLLPPALLITLGLIVFLEAHHSLYALLVLSENHNPFLLPALFSGLAVVIASLVLTPRFGVWGMLAAQGFVQAAFNNWWPVKRAVEGLGDQRKIYWQRFFSLSRL